MRDVPDDAMFVPETEEEVTKLPCEFVRDRVEEGDTRATGLLLTLALFVAEAELLWVLSFACLLLCCWCVVLEDEGNRFEIKDLSARVSDLSSFCCARMD